MGASEKDELAQVVRANLEIPHFCNDKAGTNFVRPGFERVAKGVLL